MHPSCVGRSLFTWTGIDPAKIGGNTKIGEKYPIWTMIKKKKSANNRAHFTGKYHRGLFVVQWTKYPADEDCAVDESVAHNATFTNQKALRRELRGQQKKKEKNKKTKNIEA